MGQGLPKSERLPRTKMRPWGVLDLVLGSTGGGNPTKAEILSRFLLGLSESNTPRIKIFSASYTE